MRPVVAIVVILAAVFATTLPGPASAGEGRVTETAVVTAPTGNDLPYTVYYYYPNYAELHIALYGGAVRFGLYCLGGGTWVFTPWVTTPGYWVLWVNCDSWGPATQYHVDLI